MPPRGNSVRAGGAFIDITARIARQFRGVLASVRRQFAKLSASLNRTATRIGAAAVSALAPIALLTKQFASLGDEIGKTAKRTGFSTEAISRLKFAAEQSGSSITELEAGLKRMARFLIDTEDNLATNVRAMKRLNLAVSDFQDLNPEEQFLLLAERIGTMANATEKAALAQIIFGRAGTKLIPLFNEGADGIRTLGEEAAKLGIVLDKETTQAAEDMTDGFNKLIVSLKAVAVVVGKTLAGDVKDMTERMLDAIARVREWLKENKEFIRGIVEGALKALALAAALKGVALILSAIALVLTPSGLILVGLALIAATIPRVRKAFADLLDISADANDHLSIIDKIELAWGELRDAVLGFIEDMKEGFLSVAAVVSDSAAKAAKEAAVRSAKIFNEGVKRRTEVQGRALDRERENARRARERARKEEEREQNKVATKQAVRDERRIDMRLAERVEAAEVGTELAIAAGRIPTPRIFGPAFERTRGIVADVGKTLAETGAAKGMKNLVEIEKEQLEAAQLEANAAIGTFSGRFAAQLLGGQRIQKRQLDVATDSLKKLEGIERNTAGGARFAAP